MLVNLMNNSIGFKKINSDGIGRYGEPFRGDSQKAVEVLGSSDKVIGERLLNFAIEGVNARLDEIPDRARGGKTGELYRNLGSIYADLKENPNHNRTIGRILSQAAENTYSRNAESDLDQIRGM